MTREQRQHGRHGEEHERRRSATPARSSTSRERGRDGREQEADRVERDECRSDAQADARAERAGLLLQLEPASSSSELRQGARVLGDVLGRGADPCALSAPWVGMASPVDDLREQDTGRGRDADDDQRVRPAAPPPRARAELGPDGARAPARRAAAVAGRAPCVQYGVCWPGRAARRRSGRALATRVSTSGCSSDAVRTELGSRESVA